ncbi:MAG TPA: LamG-like jellyroll fold domain-containing protein [Verrucomicrobiae bacterium]|nr:LamG-like jellyroll fold domain-containing protein [Verrucomicrobiae bacterium]
MTASSLPAANIAWVTLHSGDDTPTAAAAGNGFTNAPDKGYTALLAANGHNVTRFVSVDSVDTANPGLLTSVVTNDLIIFSRSLPSGHYQQQNETIAWNGLNKPVMHLGGYIIRGGTGGGARLGLTTGETIPDVNSDPMRLRVLAPVHPIFTGLALNATNLMVNPYAKLATFVSTNGTTFTQRGISVNNNTLPAGGTVLATVGTPGDAALNGPVIFELPAGVTVSHFNEVLPSKRLVFLTGGREVNGQSGDTAGVFDLQPDGATLFLNAVTYLTTPQVPKCTLPLVGATNLVPGDAWTFNAGVIGDEPLTYQWYHNGSPLAGAITAGLTLTDLDPTNAGNYQLFVTNNAGWATSTIAQLSFHTFAPASITNSIVCYWPLDGVTGEKTVDAVRSYDMTLVNLSGADIMPGRWGNAFYFNGTNSHMERLHATNDALPIYQYPDFTVSLWVNSPTVQPGVNVDRRVFAEGSLTDTDPLFDFGTHNAGTDGTVDIYIRNDTGGTSGDHRHTTAIAYDGNWHNIVYVQRDVGNGSMKAQMWIDGVLDPVVINPVRPLTANTTAIGALRRAGVSAWFIGMIDEVAVWSRALSAEEIGILQVTQITNAPVVPLPLAINSFKADLPAVVSGGSTTLRWDVSKDATQVTISGGVGDVTGQTSVGIGSQAVSPAETTNYVITVTRGVDSLTATTSVAVVTGVAAGWTLLDNFEQSQLGNLAASGYWNDTSGTAGQVTNVYGSKALRTVNTGVSFLNLRNLSVLENQTRTLFFRMIPGAGIPSTVTNMVGLTDKTQRGYADAVANIGPILYVAPFTNVNIPVDTNGWYLGARNGVGAAVDYFGNQPTLQTAFEAGEIYNIWVDITNAPLADFANDMFSVYVQKEGGAPRALVFQDYISDRDLFLIDPVLGSITPNLDKLIVLGNGATVSCIFDDFYLSTSGYNSTVPKPSGMVIPPGPVSITWSGNQLQISWTRGTLQSSSNVDGPYVDVLGNPASPYLVTPTGVSTFYRTRGN